MLTVSSGDIVTIDTISHEGILPDQGRDPVSFFAEHGVPADSVLRDAIELAGSAVAHDPGRDGPHVVTGPIFVKNAQPGDAVSIEVLELLVRAPYGIVSNRHGRGTLAGEFPETDEVSGQRPFLVSRFATLHGNDAVVWGPGGGLALPQRRFLGLMAVAPEGGAAHSGPPGRHGGNLDVRLLGVGSRLHLPVQVPGALVQVGDPHFAQGDGEVALTALEGPLRAVVRIELHKGGAPALPVGETDDAWVILGLHQDLDEAVRIAVRAGVAHICTLTGLDRATVYAWMSAAADIAVSQVVDGVKGVHVVVPKRWLDVLA